MPFIRTMFPDFGNEVERNDVKETKRWGRRGSGSTEGVTVDRASGRSVLERGRRALAIALASSLAVLGGAGAANAVEATVTPAPNPPMPEACELDLAFSLDLSNSVDDQQLQ